MNCISRILTALTFTALVSEAFAEQIKVCNRDSESVGVALRTVDQNNRWTTEGWYQFAPGECAIIFQGPLLNRYYYYYAVASGGGYWGGDGQHEMCVRENVGFKYTGDIDCDKFDGEVVKAIRVDIGEARRVRQVSTITLTGNTPPKPRPTTPITAEKPNPPVPARPVAQPACFTYVLRPLVAQGVMQINIKNSCAACGVVHFEEIEMGKIYNFEIMVDPNYQQEYYRRAAVSTQLNYRITHTTACP